MSSGLVPGPPAKWSQYVSTTRNSAFGICFTSRDDQHCDLENSSHPNAAVPAWPSAKVPRSSPLVRARRARQTRPSSLAACGAHLPRPCRLVHVHDLVERLQAFKQRSNLLARPCHAARSSNLSHAPNDRSLRPRSPVVRPNPRKAVRRRTYRLAMQGAQRVLAGRWFFPKET
jgi:hypothetical protein